MLDIDNYSHASIEIIMESLNSEELRLFILCQKYFWKKRFLNMISSEQYDAIVNKVIDDKRIHNIISEIEKKIKILREKNDIVSLEISDEKEIDLNKFSMRTIEYYKSLASKIKDEDHKENLENIDELLSFMYDVSRREGLAVLDFLFLRKDGLKDIIFQWLLLEVTCGRDIALRVKHSEALSYAIKNYSYAKKIFIGLKNIQKGIWE